MGRGVDVRVGVEVGRMPSASRDATALTHMQHSATRPPAMERSNFLELRFAGLGGAFNVLYPVSFVEPVDQPVIYAPLNIPDHTADTWHRPPRGPDVQGCALPGG